LIKSGGEWISSTELENLLTSHPDVAEVAVIAIPDARWEERPLAIVVRRPGADVTDRELRDHVREHVAKWQSPEHWSALEVIPKTGVGKIDKQLLRAQVADGTLTYTTLA
ncbi:MAG TPA: fatty acid--CoA ligase, partial [Dermatophilaceae bacterium]|nr:fatty acid--CoA ligase [Dermatophilaceae bacterium]